ncbi:MAG TPA: DNA polymerase III subunit beta [Gammaproteobacteria bacterium]|nr:DNA polymerase III subunit beta [Gammaproteobacteria bacterium]
MKFIISRETLMKPLQMVNGVVERRQTLPILGNVLLSVKDGMLSLTATDLEVQMRTQTRVEEGEGGEITLPARKFLDICRALPEGADIHLSAGDQRAQVRSGKSRFTLSTLPASEFPAIETSQAVLDFALPQGVLKSGLERTHFAMALQDVRYYLNGLLLELSGNRLRLVATDGHRLALCEDCLEQDISFENHQVIIPRKAVTELVRLLESNEDEARILLGGNFVQIGTPEMHFTSKLIDGRFPDYQNVVPVDSDKTVVCEREPLRQALNRVSILSNEKYRGVRMEFSPGQLRVLAHNPEHEEAEEELGVDYGGEPLEIGFNVTYLQDALNACPTERVKLLLSDPNSCCLIQGVDDQRCKYVVMPMRL